MARLTEIVKTRHLRHNQRQLWRGIFASLAAILIAIPVVAQAPPGDTPPTLAELLSKHDFQGALLPAETMRQGSKSVLAVYRVFEAQDGDIEILYGYAGTDHKSYYRSYALFARQIRFELVRTAEDKSPLLSLIREYAIARQRIAYSVHSLQADLSLPPDHRVIATESGVCHTPYTTWLTMKDTAGQVQAERLVARLVDPPLPFAEPTACPMAVPASRGVRERAVPARMRARSVAFAQGVTLEDGGFLGIASSDPMIVRFDAALNAPFFATQPLYAMIDYNAALQRDIEQSAVKASNEDPTLPAASRYEAAMWSQIDGHFGKTPAPPSSSKPPKPH